MYSASPEAIVDLPFLRPTNTVHALNRLKLVSEDSQPIVELSKNICQGINLIGCLANLPFVCFMNS